MHFTDIPAPPVAYSGSAAGDQAWIVQEFLQMMPLS